MRDWTKRRQFTRYSYCGSRIEDSVHFAERIVIPYQPKVVVFYAGDNDISGGKTAEQVEADFRQFTAKVHDKLPETRILFIAIKPSPSRWKFIETQNAANERIRKFCDSGKRLTFVDVVAKMFGTDGKPCAELFLKDQLHMTAEGYRLWNELLTPHIAAALKDGG